jgi:hypothetical protein
VGGRCRFLIVLSCAAIVSCARKSSNGPCGPLPGASVVLAEPAHQPGGISVDRTAVYFADIANDGAIMSVPKAGGPSRSVSPAVGGGFSVTDDEYVYWTYLPGRLERALKLGGPTQVLASRDAKYAEQWGPLAVDDAFVYWLNLGSQYRRATPNPGRIMRVPKSGGDVAVIAEREGLHDMTLSGEHIYWTADDGVWREPKTGGDPEHFADEALVDASTGLATHGSFALAADDGYVYWTDRSAIRRKPISGGSSEVVLAEGAGTLRLSGQCVYFTGGNAISRVNKSGGIPSRLVAFDGEKEMGGPFAVDDSAVFWTVWSKATKAWRLMKLASSRGGA